MFGMVSLILMETLIKHLINNLFNLIKPFSKLLKNNITFYLLFFLASIFCMLGCGSNNNNGLPNLKETFSLKDKNPFGGNIAFRQIKDRYAYNTIEIKKQNFSDTWHDMSYGDGKSLYICITKNLFLDDNSLDAMMQYVNSGNDLFIAANYIEDELLDKIQIREHNRYNESLSSPINFMDTTSVKSPVDIKKTFNYFYLPISNNFAGISDTEHTKILGTNQNGEPNFIVYFNGKGKLFLHCEPRAFSNYFLLQNDNHQYLQNAFSYVRPNPTHLYWDDYYNKLVYKPSDKAFSAFSEILKYPALARAFWLAISLLLLYVFFGGKRRQRKIAVIKPNENSTVNFAETVGLLYLQKKDNKNIATKMIMYFNETIRNNYFLNTNNINEVFLNTLSRKSGVALPKVESLYRAIYHAQSSIQIDDFQLQSLNNQIQSFYKK
jgi:hypothetical protein